MCFGQSEQKIFTLTKFKVIFFLKLYFVDFKYFEGECWVSRIQMDHMADKKQLFLAALLIAVKLNFSDAPRAQDNLSKFLVSLTAFTALLLND